MHLLSEPCYNWKQSIFSWMVTDTVHHGGGRGFIEKHQLQHPPGELAPVHRPLHSTADADNSAHVKGHLNQVEVSAFNKADFPGGHPSSASPPSIQCVLNITMSHDEVCTAICECLGAGNDANPNHPGPEYMQLTAPACGYAMRHPVPDQSPFLRSTWTTLDASLLCANRSDV